MFLDNYDRSPSQGSQATGRADVAIIGAGPYGLSLAAYLENVGVSFRIFGEPMGNWLNHMPQGMLLKSDGLASNLYDPDNAFPLSTYCAENGVSYADTGTPVPVDTFYKYGLAFQNRFVPKLERTRVISISRASAGFVLRLASNETFSTRRVVLAVGVEPFATLAPPLDRLPAGRVSHSFAHSRLESFAGKRVAVVGGGASAIDLATLIGESGGEVTLVSRRAKLKFGSPPNPGGRAFWRHLRHPPSGLGPGWRSRLSADAPLLFHQLPVKWRAKIVGRHLGPAAAWPMQERMSRAAKAVLRCEIAEAAIAGDEVELSLRRIGGVAETLRVDHVIAATGYRIDVSRIEMLDARLRAEVSTFEGAPILSRDFETSIRGLYFVGPAAALSFGPLLRFAFGAKFAAHRVSMHLRRSVVRSACTTGCQLNL